MLPAHDNLAPLPPAPRLVLDTNVVLDWLVFGDPRCRAVIDAIEARQVQWITTDAMGDELASVLARPFRSGRTLDADAVWGAWQRWAVIVSAPKAASLARNLSCTDPDDQMFVDLAVAIGARWLLTRDRALLALARRALAFGVAVLRPDDWKLDDPAPKFSEPKGKITIAAHFESPLGPLRASTSE